MLASAGMTSDNFDREHREGNRYDIAHGGLTMAAHLLGWPEHGRL